MLSGQIPFLSMQNTAMLSTNEITRHLTLTGKIWNNVSQEAKELVQGNVSFKFCYSGQLNSRPTIARNNNKTLIIQHIQALSQLISGTVGCYSYLYLINV